MHLKITKQALSRAVKNVLPAVGGGTIPIYGAIRIETLSDGLTLAAMDGQLTLVSVATATVQTPGAICVFGKALANVVTTLKDEVLEIALTEGRLQIRGQRAAVHLNTLPAEDFPITANYNAIQYTEFADFFKTVDLVSFAAAKEPDRPTLRGLLLGPTELVAVDGRRLATRAHRYPVNADRILPAESLQRLRRIFTEPSVGMALGDTEVHFHHTDRMATVRCLEGPYPDYRRVFPQGPKQIATTNRQQLLDALNVVSVVADEGVHVVLAFGNTLRVFAQSSDRGEAFDEIECNYRGNSIELALNATYLQQALDRITDDLVTFELRESKPIVLTGDGYAHVIMPRRVN